MKAVELSIAPRWGEIEGVRIAVLDAVEGFFGDGRRELGEAMAMIASELVENAVKYGDQAKTSEVRIKVAVENKTRITITVASKVAGGGEHLRRLEDTIAWIESFSQPKYAYEERVRVVAMEHTHGGVGLVRIAYEGQSKLHARVEKGVLYVEATHDTRGPKPSIVPRRA